jgi:hypothetical protein
MFTKLVPVIIRYCSNDLKARRTDVCRVERTLSAPATHPAGNDYR